MKYTPLFLLLLAPLCLPACKTADGHHTEAIDPTGLEPETVNISQFASGMHTVRLETREECLLGDISRIKMDNEHLYIQDAIFQGIYVFDKTGAFVKKLYKEGRGPGEYLSIYDFTIDERQNTIEIYDGKNRKLFIYALSDFRFIREISFPFTAVFEFEKNNGIYYFNTRGLRNIVNGKKTNSYIIAFDPGTEEAAPLADQILPDEVYRSFGIKGFSVNNNGQLFFSKAWDDRFYRVEKMSVTPLLRIHAGQRGAPDAIRNGTYEEQEQYLNSPADNKGHYLLFRLDYYDKDKIFILFSQGNRPSTPHYYVRTGDKEYIVNNIKNDFIAARADLNLRALLIVNHTFVAVVASQPQWPYVEMWRYVSDLGVQPDDNPVILLFPFKE